MEDDEGCDCEKCKLRKKYRLEGISRAEKKFDELISGRIYTMGIPIAKVKTAFEKARNEIK